MTNRSAGHPTRRPTMTDVAELAGVSLKTVSRVINNVPSVNQEMVDSVLTAVKQLGFRRNDLARSLRAGDSTATIGLAIEDLANPFYSTIASAVAEVAREHDTHLITASSEESPERERDLLLELCQRRADGLLVVPAGTDHSYLRLEIEMGTPVVFLDRPPTGLLCDAVFIDNRGGASAGITRLLEDGHQRIGVIMDSLAIYTMRERLAGVQAALAAAGLPYDDALIRVGVHEPEAAAGVAAGMLDSSRPPTAFFCGNNRISVGVLEELWHRDSDAALMGFDDFELSRLMPRPLTVIAFDLRELGRKGAEMLFKRIDGDRSWPTTEVLPTTLLERGVSRRA
ncbi:LacI family DNA-binding transcriptional regulator [Streptomyces sp. ISL-100]|uniref:LacI family DNA-binding transcriptional regulator n=1 Tax=Streptomyces sp. ISL-100 TaxID=2819173 RepID=UPI001BE6B141|nr:LacI family DNA-binding transcriptional regulator [Streptomyces sp. ISL-100]MBT2395372.1 LacI family DNA-binding transcriptional regulator [Streptomyces sp. ISL-100]